MRHTPAPQVESSSQSRSMSWDDVVYLEVVGGKGAGRGGGVSSYGGAGAVYSGGNWGGNCGVEGGGSATGGGERGRGGGPSPLMSSCGCRG